MILESIFPAIPHFCSMDPATTIIMERSMNAGGSAFRIVMSEEDLSSIYPGMRRFTVELSSDGGILGVMRTNSYEYSPLTHLHARDVAEETVRRWEEDLLRDPGTFISSLPPIPRVRTVERGNGTVIIQGSPRPAGNCAILSSWAADAARDAGAETTVLFPHDLEIHPCIGCYQCYNTGTCVFQDDMLEVIDAVSRSRLVIVCTPVYTNTVPAGLKALMDRFQAFHAERTLGGQAGRGTGLLMAVAGRTGTENFRCVKAVAGAFFSILGITPVSPILVDGMDRISDLRSVAGVREQVRTKVKDCLVR